MIMTDYVRFLLALIAVLGMIGVLAWLARRFRLGHFAGTTKRSGRLGVVETLSVDGRQRLVLIRRDDREHLLLIGQERSSVIERGIEAPAVPAASLTSDRQEALSA